MKDLPPIERIKGNPSPGVYDVAAGILRSGGLVAFPTETVYGIGADATNSDAIERLNQVKGRSPDKPYSLHIHTAEQIEGLVSDIPEIAKCLMDQFWPGPLTIVMHKENGETIGFRLPSDPIALAFLSACKVPVAAPSANRSGSRPARNAEEVLKELNGDIDYLIDGGETTLRCESTVIEVRGGEWIILREGAIPKDNIDQLLNAKKS